MGSAPVQARVTAATAAARRVRLAALFASAAALAACGGGGDTSTPVPSPPPPAAATFSLSLGGGRQGGVDHAWVTVTGVALHPDPTVPYVPGDASWTSWTLATPVTLDLASQDATSGALVDLLDQVAITPGTYAQLRLLVADPDAALLAPAQAAGLRFNAQVDYRDGGTVRAVPLEFAGRTQGLALPLPLSVSQGGAAFIALEWDAADSLVRRASPDGIDRFTVRNTLRAYDRTRTGAVLGLVDATRFCAVAPVAGCIDDVTAEAHAVPPDGGTAVRARSAQVITTGTTQGAFFLYPLPDTATVDVVLRGRNMDTMVVRGVAVQPGGSLFTIPTAVGSASAPLVPVRDTATRTVTLAAATQPRATHATFFQTPASGAAALPLAEAATDPATGLWRQSVTLPAGPLQVATYDAAAPNTALAFTPTTPVEGAGGYQVRLGGSSTELPSALQPLPLATSSWVPPALQLVPGLVTGTLTVHLTGVSTADRAELVIGNDTGVVAVVDLTSSLPGAGLFSLELPAGVDAVDPLATLYTVTLRTWRASDMAGTLRHAEAVGVANLRAATTADVAVAWP